MIREEDIIVRVQGMSMSVVLQFSYCMGPEHLYLNHSLSMFALDMACDAANLWRFEYERCLRVFLIRVNRHCGAE